jgi:hypothetical protein
VTGGAPELARNADEAMRKQGALKGFADADQEPPDSLVGMLVGVGERNVETLLPREEVPRSAVAAKRISRAPAPDATSARSARRPPTGFLSRRRPLR